MPHFGEYRPPLDIGGLGAYTYKISTDGTLVWVSDDLGNRVYDPIAAPHTPAFQWAVDNLNKRGRIYVEEGAYDFQDIGLEIPYDAFISIIGGCPSRLGYSIFGTDITCRTENWLIKSKGYTAGDENGFWHLENLNFYMTHYEGKGNGIHPYMVNELDWHRVNVSQEKTDKPAGYKGIWLESTAAEHANLTHCQTRLFDTGWVLDAAHLNMQSCVATSCNIGFGYTTGGRAQNSMLDNCQAHDCVDRGFQFRANRITLVNPQVEILTSATGIAFDLIGVYAYAIIHPHVTNLAGGAIPLQVGSPSILTLIEPRVTATFDGYRTENWGTQDITGAVNAVNVTHNLVATPDNVRVTELQDSGHVWVTAKGAATFTINFSVQPGGATWYFDWKAHV